MPKPARFPSSLNSYEDWWDEIQPRTLAAVKVLMEEAMEVELVEELNAAKYRRTEFRRGYRNGYRYRGLLAELGPIEQIRVPRDRDGQYGTKVLPSRRSAQQAGGLKARGGAA